MPLLKRVRLGKEDTKNYRSISNFPVIFRLIPTVVARSSEDHIEHNNLRNRYQSAYRGHCAETVLLKLRRAIAEGSMTTLILIDLFPYFDVIDYPLRLTPINRN